MAAGSTMGVVRPGETAGGAAVGMSEEVEELEMGGDHDGDN